MGSQSRSVTDVKLNFGRQVGFGLGEFAGQFFFSYWSSYLSVYYTDVVGIAPAVVSIIFIIARIWDAINDPIMGNIADRHKSKRWGRYRPWILFGTPVLAILSILMFHVPNVDSSQMKIVYITITYILAGMAFTAVNIPYMSMQATLTTNIKSRQDISNMKSVFTCVGTVTLNLICMPILLKFSGAEKANARGYLLGTILFTAMGVILYYIMFASTKEVYYPEQHEVKADLKTTLKYVFGNPDLIIVMLGLFFSMLSMFSRIGIAVYYYIYCMNQPAMVGVLMMLPPLCGIPAQYLIPKLPFSRKLLLMISFVVKTVSLIGIFLMDYHNLTGILILLVIYGIFNYDQGVLWGLVAPAIDATEVKTGLRMDGTVYAFSNLFLKVASAIGAAIGLLIMGAMGYVANAQQTATALTGINISTNILPAVFAIAAVIPFLFFRMTPEQIEENSRILAERREGKHN